MHLWGRRESALAETQERIHATAPDRVHYQTVNIREADSVDSAMEQLWNDHGPLTGLINNAAANFIAPAESISPKGYEAIASTVMDGSYFTTHAAGRHWIASGLSVEWAKHNIRLNAVAPGPFPTDFTWQALGADNPANALSSEAGMPMGRPGKMSELANLVLFLISDAADYLTGQTIAIDGAQMYAGPATFASLTAMSEDDWAQAQAAAKKATAASKADRRA